MADNSNDPAMQNQDVIQAAPAGFRTNPVLFAALVVSPDCRPSKRRSDRRI